MIKIMLGNMTYKIINYKSQLMSAVSLRTLARRLAFLVRNV